MIGAAAIAAMAAAVWLAAGPPTPDLAAQVFRTELFEREGFTVFDLHWFGGHHTPGYSLVFPPLAALLGPRLVAALAAVASAVLFARLAERHFGPAARPGVLWFGAATATDLVLGRLTFAAGVAAGLGALLALQRGRTGVAVALAVATTAVSPVAGLFLALGGLAVAVAGRRRDGLVLAAGALLPALLLAIALPEGGFQPFGARAALVVVAVALGVFALLPAGERTLRAGALLYAAATVAAFALSTPMGSNATRLAALFAGPLLACALAGRAPRRVLVAAALPLLAYQWWGPVREAAKGADDPSAERAYFAPLLAELDRRAGPDSRVEIPFTRLHWEAVHVAPRHALARGWEAQLDRDRNALFFEDSLDPDRYERWLRENGVRFVALPDVPLDPGGREEARLIRSRPRFLLPVWRNAHWRLYAVAGAPGLVRPQTGARVTRASAESFTLEASRGGPVEVRVRWTPYWRVVAGAGCVAPAANDWTTVEARRAGTLRVEARFAPARIRSRGRACSG